MKRDVDYIVHNNGIMIIDAFTGRMMPGRRYSDGLHQAIEAKENVEIRKENKTLATITFQNYFRMYEKLSGMTGTALSEENEFREIYYLDVVEVPTNKPMIRIDNNDVVYKTAKAKENAIIEQIKACHAKGQPVLVGTVSIEKSELLSRRLRGAGIKHTVLNAKYHDREAEIIAQAGKLGAVTISTNMAGRGTDIMLGGNAEYLAKAEMRRLGYDELVIAQATGYSQSVPEEVFAARQVYRELYKKYQQEIAPEAEKVKAAGGLFVIGTERHESRRIDNQLRGRAGRQGDPGESRFYISLEDDLIRLFGGDKLFNLVDRLNLPDDMPINSSILTKSIESAQKRIESLNFERRKNVLEYDDVMNQQRTIIYKQRYEVLEGADLSEKIKKMIRETIAEAVEFHTAAEDPSDWDLSSLRDAYLGVLCTKNDFKYSEEELKKIKREDIVKVLTERAERIYHEKEEKYGAEWMRNVERNLLLRNVDRHWMEHLEAMEELRDSIRLQAYAQRNPITEYRITGAELFNEMTRQIRNDTVRMILSAIPREEYEKRRQIARITSAGFASTQKTGPVNVPVVMNSARPAPAQQQKVKQMPVRKTAAQKIGRNDPCPCGSGKKYKNCCGFIQREVQ
jgi:preprotein translocase subunit SecA